MEEYVSVGDEAPSADLVVAYRFSGRNATPGCRVDLECSEYGERVVLGENGQRLVAGGAKIFCRECAAPRFEEAHADPG
jgi:hypothetical protein